MRRRSALPLNSWFYREIVGAAVLDTMGVFLAAAGTEVRDGGDVRGEGKDGAEKNNDDGMPPLSSDAEEGGASAPGSGSTP